MFCSTLSYTSTLNTSRSVFRLVTDAHTSNSIFVEKPNNTVEREKTQPLDYYQIYEFPLLALQYLNLPDVEKD